MACRIAGLAIVVVTTFHEQDAAIWKSPLPVGRGRMFEGGFRQGMKTIISKGECHLWSASLKENEAKLPQLYEPLSVEERQQAARFHFDKDRNMYILAHGLLRRLLARYLDIRPESLDFFAGASGKPQLAKSACPLDLRFNISHTRGLAAVALALDHDVGVDVECLERSVDWPLMAKRILCERENAEVNALPEAEKQAAFFKGWVCKEAVLKATGEGIAGGMDQVEVSLSPGKEARLLAFRGDTSASSRWTLHTLSISPNVVAAVAVDAPNVSLVVRQWDGES